MTTVRVLCTWGEILRESGALKAGDLQYLGRFARRRASAHFWRLLSRRGGKPSFADVLVDGEGRPVQYRRVDRVPSRSKRLELHNGRMG